MAHRNHSKFANLAQEPAMRCNNMVKYRYMQKNPTRFPKGNVFIDGDVDPRPHEIEIAKVLAKAGYKVRFLPNNAILGTADAYINDAVFEFKSPEGSTVRSIERNLVKALNHQSPNIVVSTTRMKKIQDRSVKSFLMSRLREGKAGQTHEIK